MIESVVDRLVIRGDDPREPHASNSNMKLRALCVAVSPGIVSLAGLSLIDAPEAATMLIPIALVFASVKAISQPINDRIAELEAAENVVCWDCGMGPTGIEDGVCQICGNTEVGE